MINRIENSLGINHNRIMLTKSDIQQIKEVVVEVVEQKLEEKLEQKLEEKLEQKLEQKLKPIKRDLNYLKKTLSVAIRRFDETDVNHEKRILKIEDTLGFPSEN